MTAVTWDRVGRADVLRAVGEYDRLGPAKFFSAHGYGPTTTYDLIWAERLYPPKAILGVAYEFATGQRLLASDFEGGRAGAVRVLGRVDSPPHPRSPRRGPPCRSPASGGGRGVAGTIGARGALKSDPATPEAPG